MGLLIFNPLAYRNLTNLTRVGYNNNNNLNKIQKFYYLQSCLRGEATQVLHSLEICEANYNIGIGLLKKPYGNNRTFIHTHVKNLFDIPVVPKESHQALRKFTDNFVKNYRALKSLGEPVEHWDTTLIYLIANKLDSHTRHEWEGSIKKDLPKLDDLLNFLKNKCHILETLDSKISDKTLHKSANKSSTDKQVVRFLQGIQETLSVAHFTSKIPTTRTNAKDYFRYHLKNVAQKPNNVNSAQNPCNPVVNQQESANTDTNSKGEPNSDPVTENSTETVANWSEVTLRSHKNHKTQVLLATVLVHIVDQDKNLVVSGIAGFDQPV
ncbi:hypothetical protein ILUMI_21500 [Ignelater luminosus]|uniref:Uncharacterized protein n=1 Tax=Ignelater luminosus TaxID=2038154 RepID=A0A8K0CIS5_IGNLU|nr:hypothetical protein ILUMI_21500 [Ignelater luminosus]